MATVVKKELRLDSTNATQYFTASMNVLNRDDCLAKLYLNNDNKVDVVMNAACKEYFYPSATAKPFKADTSMRYSRQVGGTAKFDFYIDGTSIQHCESSSNSYTTTTATGITSSAITNSTRNSTIKFYLWQNNTTRGARLLWDNFSLYFYQYECSATNGTGIASASVSNSAPYSGDEVTFTCTLSSGYEWDGWYNGNTRVSTSQSYTCAAADLSLEARTKKYTVTVTTGEGISSASSNPTSQYRNMQVTLQASMADKYKFGGWYIGSALISSQAQYTYTVTDNVTIQATAIPKIVPYVKQNGVWIQGKYLYRKINGTWTKLLEMPSDVPANTKFIKK